MVKIRKTMGSRNLQGKIEGLPGFQFYKERAGWPISLPSNFAGFWIFASFKMITDLSTPQSTSQNHTLKVHLKGTPQRHTSKAHLKDTPQRHTSKTHLKGTPQRHASAPYLIADIISAHLRALIEAYKYQKAHGHNTAVRKGITESCKRYRGVGIANRGVGISNRV
jgi:hypothetical protein